MEACEDKATEILGTSNVMCLKNTCVVVFFAVEDIVCKSSAVSQLYSEATMPAQNLNRPMKTACFTVSVAALRSKGIEVEL